VLLSLVVDVSQLAETAERLKVQVFTLAKEHGIKVPKEIIAQLQKCVQAGFSCPKFGG
jgi:hypothetical protein